MALNFLQFLLLKFFITIIESCTKREGVTEFYFREWVRDKIINLLTRVIFLLASRQICITSWFLAFKSGPSSLR